MKVSTLFVVCCGLCSCVSFSSMVAASSEIREVRATAVDTPPRIDGDLSDACWGQATWQSDFRRIHHPELGAPAHVPTRFCVMYDSCNLYFAVEMHGDDPRKLLHTTIRRDDNLDLDDSIAIYIDSFHDRRSAYFFQINPIGTQRDLSCTAHGAQVDIGWDGIWLAEPRITDDGWQLEVCIPFKILRFEWSDAMTWGFDFLRESKQHEETSEWCHIEDNRQSTLDPRLYGTLTGLDNVAKPLMLQAIGTTVGSIRQTNRDATGADDGDGWSSNEQSDAGLDVVWGMTPQITVNATINPDFAQIEADPDQLNLTGEELFLEERRPFFRENSALLRSTDGETPFYSRRIVDISQGMKVTGQAFNSDFAALVVNGKDGARTDSLFGVFKSQTPVTSEVTVCGWVITKFDRDSLNDFQNIHGESYGNVDNDFNVLGGLDAQYQPGNWLMRLHAYRTWYPDETRAWYTAEKGSNRDTLHMSLRYYGDNWIATGDYKEIGLGYYPELGFTNIAIIGNRMFTPSVWKRYTFEDQHWMNYIQGQVVGLIATPRDDADDINVLGTTVSIDAESDCRFSAGVTGEWYLDDSFAKFETFPRDENDQIMNPIASYFAGTMGNDNSDCKTMELRASWTDGGWRGIGGKYITGMHYFSRMHQYNVWLNWMFANRLTTELSLDYLERYSPTRQHLEYNPDWNDWGVWIPRMKLTFQFSRDLYVRSIVSGYLDHEKQNNRYNISTMAAYDFLPGSKLYLVYEHTWQPYDMATDMLLGLDEMTRLDQLFYIKISYMMNL